MKYTILGKTGITVSKIALGMMSFGNSQEWHLEIDEALPIVKYAIDAGINFFDTANVYSSGRSEEITGELLSEYRDDVVIATKIRFRNGKGKNDKGLNRYHMVREVKASLKRLQTDRIDLYQIHRWDNTTDIEYVMRSLNHLIDGGLVSHIGASSMYAWQFAKAQYTAKMLGLEQFSTMSNHYNAIYREEEREMIPQCIDQKVAIIPWSPLGRGFLSGKYKSDDKLDSYARYRSDPYLKQRYFHHNDFEVLSVIEKIALENDISISQTALAWLLSQPGVTSPIVGVSKLQQLEELVDAVDIHLSPDDIKQINDAYQPHPIIGHAYTLSDDMVSHKNK